MNKPSIIVMILLMIMLFFAGESYGLTMGPARLEVSLPPREIAEGDYYVQNDTDQNVHISVEPENWFKETYNYGKLGIKDWVEFDTYEFDLKPKEIKKLRLRIKVPKDVKGELVSQIFFTSAVLDKDKKPNLNIKARVGSVLYVAIKGTEVIDAEIKSISISKQVVENIDKHKIEVNVSNKGNVHIRPTGKVVIQDNAGKKLVELDIVSGKPALPGQEIVYEALWEKSELKNGLYKALITINYGKELGAEKTVTMDRTFEVSEDGGVTIK